jgi:2-dehydro-3-deoxygluconokinase
MRGKLMAPETAAYDVVGFGETMLRFSTPDGGRLEDARTFESYVAGTESNALAGASRLGLRCAWISALPENPFGRRVVGELRRHGVDTRGVVWVNDLSRLGVFYAEEAPAPVGTRVHYDSAGYAIALLAGDAVDLSILETARVLH